jgi:hypothetical protein
MKIQFITAQVNFITNDLHQAIQTQLETQGEPLRWAITAVEDEIAFIEAVVLQSIDRVN